MRAMDRVIRVGALVAVGVVLATACSSSSHADKASATTAPSTPAPSTTIATPAGLQTVTVSPTARQTIDGFGASGAWWPIDLAKFPVDAQQEVGKLLFSAQGIALSGYRYNIGGGGKGVTTPNRAPNEFADDSAGRMFLRMANDAQVPVLTGFVNSAPPQFTTNGQACGGTLKPGMEVAYAQYLAGVVKQLRDEDHVTLRYVSPMNEPDDSFGGCGQEGMQVPVAQRAALVKALGKELVRTAGWAVTIADETTADAIAADEIPQWLADGEAASNVAAIAHHTYDFPNDDIRKLLPPIAAKFHKPTWMTEICCYKGSGGVASSFGANYDPTMTQGFWLADQIESDFTVAGDSAWYWWTALSPVLGCDPKADPACPSRVNTKGFNDGLIYYDEHGVADGVTKLFTTKRLYVLGQFSRYVRPGAVRHDVTGVPKGVHAMAFANGEGWTLVTWNETSTPATYGLRLRGTVRPHEVHITDDSPTDNLILGGAGLPAKTDRGAWLVQLPARTIATYTFLK